MYVRILLWVNVLPNINCLGRYIHLIGIIHNQFSTLNLFLPLGNRRENCIANIYFATLEFIRAKYYCVSKTLSYGVICSMTVGTTFHTKPPLIYLEEGLVTPHYISVLANNNPNRKRNYKSSSSFYWISCIYWSNIEQPLAPDLLTIMEEIREKALRVGIVGYGHLGVLI